MAEDNSVIIIGGGVAGLTAAYVLAQAGIETMLVERGNYCGAKNVTGGRLYGYSLEKVIPGFADEAPVEREIRKGKLVSLHEGESISKEYCTEEIEPNGKSYSVLRSKFDQWLAEKAEEAGVMLITGIRVDDLIVRDGRVCGVIAGEDELESSVVIFADGVLSLLGQKVGVTTDLPDDRAMVGVKEVIELSAQTINERFGLSDGEGAAWTFKGLGTDGLCEGYLYTNKDSVSVGVNMVIGEIGKSEDSIPQLLEDFKNREEIAPLIEGGTLKEYSAHVIPMGNAEDLNSGLYGDGYLIVGDAARLCADMGITLHGMDLAIESGRIAAETVIEAMEKDDLSADALKKYADSLRESIVMRYLQDRRQCEAAVKDENDPISAVQAVLAEIK